MIDLSKCKIGTRLLRRDGVVVELTKINDSKYPYTCGNNSYKQHGYYTDSMLAASDIIKIMNTETKQHELELAEKALNDAQEHIKNLKEQTQAEKKPKGGLFVPEVCDTYYFIGQFSDGNHHVGYSIRSTSPGHPDTPQFRTREAAQAKMDADLIWMQWNMCEGVVGSDSGEQWYIDWEMDACGTKNKEYTEYVMSPLFDTDKNAEASIDTIGRDRITQCRRGMHFNPNK